jgi:hypothetical protein
MFARQLVAVSLLSAALGVANPPKQQRAQSHEGYSHRRAGSASLGGDSR